MLPIKDDSMSIIQITVIVIAILFLYIWYANIKASKLVAVGILAGEHYVKTGDKVALIAFQTAITTCSKAHQKKISDGLDDSIKLSYPDYLGTRPEILSSFFMESGIKASIQKKRELSEQGQVGKLWLQAINKANLELAKKIYDFE